LPRPTCGALALGDKVGQQGRGILAMAAETGLGLEEESINVVAKYLQSS
jgi:hypothetical protein